jgi:hypothetical protein
MSDSMASEPRRAELVELGCAHCGAGREFKIIGPGAEDPDWYHGWGEIAVRGEVERLNRIFEVGVKHAEESRAIG